MKKSWSVPHFHAPHFLAHFLLFATAVILFAENEALAAAPAYRASGTFTAGAGAITPPYPASMAANDVCLLAVESENEAISLTTANGFVEVSAWSPQSAGAAATNPSSRLALFWKRTVGGDTAPVVADSGDHTTGQIHCFSGVITSGNPWDTGAGGNDGGINDTTGTIPGSTTTVVDTLVVLITSTSFNGTSTAQCSDASWTNANLTSLTERTDNTNTQGLGGGHCLATGVKASASAYVATTVTLANTSFKGAISLALKSQPPTVVSINMASANPTLPATAVAWTVTFSESVTGVDTSDFSLVQAGGVTGATITSVTGAGTTRTVNANTGAGGGTLGLNLVDDDTIVNASAIPLGGAGAGNDNFTGQIYNVFSCTPPSNTPVGLTVTCQCDTFGRASLNPSTIFGGNWVATTSDATGIVPRIVNQGYMRLTENTGNNAKAATVPGIFPAAGNYISVEFLQYAYNGSNPGADGIAVTLSDYAVPAQPGAFGGSLGYAQRTGVNGFSGGWVGVALDEYGNYQNPTEGRSGGPGFIVQSVGVRGSGSGTTGYPWLKGTANLTTVAPNVGIDDRASLTPSLGDYYQVIVDSRGNNGVSGPALVSVNRDITGVGNAYSPLIAAFDAYAAATAVGYTQAPVPQNWQISFTGSTGGSTNIHEIGALRICAQTMVPTTGGTPGGFNAIDEVYTRSDVNAVSGHLYTKLAGTAFTIKVAALNAGGSGILTTYALSGNKTVTVKLIDDNGGTSCNASAAACSACGKPVVATQTMTFASTDTGFKQSGNFTVPAYANLIVQMSDGTTTGCSVDTFAVRPSGIASVTSSNATNVTTAGTPIFKAGSDNFSLSATTTAITGNSGYAGGALKINANAVQAASPATVTGVLAGSFAAATSGASSATATGSTFTYSEVGAFNLLGPDFTLTPTRIPGVYDDTWTTVDSGAKNDCVSGTTAAAYSNTKNANGKYGCNFGISVNTGVFGRFVPDHFTLISAQTRQRNDITPGYAATRETTGTIAAGTALLAVADTTDFSVGDTVVVFGAGAGGKDLIVTITASAANVLTLSAPAATGVTNTSVFERLGFTYMDEPLQLALSLEARNAAGGKTQNYANATGLAKLDNSSLTGTANNSWGLSGIVNNLYGVANCRALFSSVAPYNTTYSGGGCASLPANVPVAPYAASTARVSPSSTATVTWTAGATSLTTDITLKRASRPDGAFNFTNGTFALGIWPKDGDGITFLSANDGASLLNAAKSLDTDAVAGADVVAVGVADMRFGRMRFSNAYGSELLDLVLPMEVQYWNWNLNGGTFIRNTLDSHTPLVNTGAGTTNFGLSNYRRSLASGETSLLPASTITFANGAANMRLSRPGAGNSGSVKVCADLDAVAGTGDTTCQAAGGVANKPYLQGGAGFNIDPSADIAFGTHKSGPVIYLREGY